ncbi:MAG: hypothetical protein VYE81_02620 [Planctomycetota bacterium]|nr:hypothetical protein [Planctomycetota bacterium]
MAKSPQSFEKRQRERRKQMKRKEKLERRYERSAEKKQTKESGDAPDDDRQKLEGDDDEGLRWTGEEEVVEEDEEDEGSQGAEAGKRRENR